MIYTFRMEHIKDNHFFRGAIGGLVGILMSQPVDALKTYYQTKTSLTEPFKYNIRNLYRGASAVLYGTILEKAAVFGTFRYATNELQLNTPIAGALSGISAAFVVTPYERIKILCQTKQKVVTLSPMFFYKGLSVTFTREVPGFALYFWTFETLKDLFYTSQNKSFDIKASFLFGGISGITAWIFIYPQDRIKTIIQSSTNGNTLSIKKIIENTYKTGGLRQFYSGFVFAAARATLLHSGAFGTVEMLKKYF